MGAGPDTGRRRLCVTGDGLCVTNVTKGCRDVTCNINTVFYSSQPREQDGYDRMRMLSLFWVGFTTIPLCRELQMNVWWRPGLGLVSTCWSHICHDCDAECGEFCTKLIRGQFREYLCSVFTTLNDFQSRACGPNCFRTKILFLQDICPANICNFWWQKSVVAADLFLSRGGIDNFSILSLGGDRWGCLNILLFAVDNAGLSPI